MKRQHPLMSLFGFLFTLALLAGMAFVLWYRGGEAFSPGKLSAKSQPDVVLQGFTSHADFEPQCSRCHQPLETTQDSLCLVCHKDIAAQIRSENGTHGHIDASNQCARCHSDHHGPDFDTTMAAFTHFDHSKTHFTLVWHQVNYDATPMECQACHTMKPKFEISTASCAECHKSKDPAFMQTHIQQFGDQCAVCHDGQDRMIGFDHQTTQFPLTGKHSVVQCAGCHSLDQQAKQRETAMVQTSITLDGGPTTGVLNEQDPFKNTPTECARCHEEPPQHLGMFDSQCEHCHTTNSWMPATLDGKSFDHNIDSRFSLVRHQFDFQINTMSCSACHNSDVNNLDVQTCIQCHSENPERAAFMVKHQQDYGLGCVDCHDGKDRMHNFDHADFFPLEGKHVDIECNACHENQVFVGTPTECVQCHQEPEIHAGFFGLQCQNCHTSQAWAPALMTVHTFPLDHGNQGEVECKTCHLDAYVQYTCYGCHDHQEGEIIQSHTAVGIALEEIPNCTKCHTTGIVEEKP